MFDPARFFDGREPKIMGIVNATGDSFSEGATSTPETAVERALALAEAGADILDIGGESTRPGAEVVTPQMECDRVLPVIEAVHRALPDLPLSCDTRNGSTAEAALQAGCVIVNDVGMGAYDPGTVTAAARHGAVLVLCHSRGIPQTMQNSEFTRYDSSVVSTVRQELEQAAQQAIASGVSADHIWLDPGIGFAKSADQCWEMVARVAEFSDNYRWLWGISRKSFIGALTGEKNPLDRLGGTLAAELYLAANWVDVIRTHEVRQLRYALMAIERIKEERNK